MIGRYGMDQLGQFTMSLVIVLIVLNIIVRSHAVSTILDAVEFAGLITIYLRMFSRNIQRRYEENQAYLKIRFAVMERLGRVRSGFTEGRRYRIFKCPGCGQKVRVPRGHGKVSIHCPKCGRDFVKKS